MTRRIASDRSPCDRRAWAAGALAAIGALAAAPLHAQDTAIDERAAARAAACRAAIPDSMLRPTTVRLVAPTLPAMAGQPPAAPSTIAAAQQVLRWTADAIRALVGSPDGATAVDGLVGWRALEGVQATFTLDAGRLAWRVGAGYRGAPAPTDTTGLVLLAQALDAVRDSIATLAVPAEVGPAAPTFPLAFSWREPEAGEVEPVRLDAPFDHPLFQLAVPAYAPPRPLDRVAPRYPDAAHAQAYRSEVRVMAVVTEEGRIDPRTLRAVWVDATPVAGDMLPAGLPTSPGRQPTPLGFRPIAPVEAASLFTSASLAAVRSVRFTPARIGGCPTRQEVLQTFRFDVRY